MQYKDFHGKNISRLGLGALRFPTEPGNPERFIREEGQKVLDAALKGGINYIDTAYSYQNGDSERFLGEALQKYPRDSYYLATKFSLSVITDIEAAFEEQLQRLQTEYFDFICCTGCTRALWMPIQIRKRIISVLYESKKNWEEYAISAFPPMQHRKH